MCRVCPLLKVLPQPEELHESRGEYYSTPFFPATMRQHEGAEFTHMDHG